MGEVARAIPVRRVRRKQETLSQDTLDLIEERRRAWERGDGERARVFTKTIRRAVRAERRKRLLQMVSKDLDVREYWLGLKQLKKGYCPIPYALKDARGKTVSLGARAEAAAEFLAEKYGEGQKATRVRRDNAECGRMTRRST